MRKDLVTNPPFALCRFPQLDRKDRGRAIHLILEIPAQLRR